MIEDTPLPRKAEVRIGDIVGLLTSLRGSEEEAAPAWSLEINLRVGTTQQRLHMPLEPFLTAAELEKSIAEPTCFADLKAIRGATLPRTAAQVYPPRWLWLFRHAIYATERIPRPSEIDQVVLKIKAQHHHRDDALNRLKKQVANFEATEVAIKKGSRRRTLTDDVKLLVWARDGGSCVKCNGTTNLHFDHIIPYSRGGSDESENIQILCGACNLSKGNRLA